MRGISFDGVPVTKAPRKQRKQPRESEATFATRRPMIDVTTFGDAKQTYIAGFGTGTLMQEHIDATANDPWQVMLSVAIHASMRMRERRRNKDEFGLAVLDKDLPTKHRRKREAT